MREIKFRGKRAYNPDNLENNEFVYGNYSNDPCPNITWNNKQNELDVSEVVKETIGQFTGLKDKNGVEIFEGDIVNSNYFKNASVVFWRYGWYFNTGKDNHHSFNTASHSFEIIGNIHENPELLCTSQST